MKQIKWGCIQPLTGGMYIGARKAIGNEASWIISYPGTNETKYDKKGTLVSAGNEYNLTQWLKKHNAMVPYYTFSHKMYENKELTDVKISLTDYPENYSIESDNGPDFSDIDIVVAVPVCSGLSGATIAGQETKDTRNCNMMFIANYALAVVKPKIYIFENAPALFSGAAAKPVRDKLNYIAEKYNYSIVYYKTDTKYHDNCQRRPRTFVMFVRNDEKHNTAPVLQYEHKLVNVVDYLSRIPSDATQQVTATMRPDNVALFEYIKEKYGPKYRDNAKSWTIANIIDDNLWDDFANWLKTYNGVSQQVKDKLNKLFNHIQEKISEGKNFYCLAPGWSMPTDETVSACMFKSIPTLMHYSEDRLYTIREWLHIMGHPHDFELYGSIDSNYEKLGQNVPVRTVQWIVSEAVRVINGDVEYTDSNIAFFNNTKYTK